MLSWLAPDALPPSVPQLQRAVPGYAGGREWIGVPDAVSLLDILCCAPVRVRHVPARRPAAELRALEAELREHFDTGGGPVMVGGGGDVYSKTIVGVRGAVEGVLLPMYSVFNTLEPRHTDQLGIVCRRGLADRSVPRTHARSPIVCGGERRVTAELPTHPRRRRATGLGPPLRGRRLAPAGGGCAAVRGGAYCVLCSVLRIVLCIVWCIV